MNTIEGTIRAIHDDWVAVTIKKDLNLLHWGECTIIQSLNQQINVDAQVISIYQDGEATVHIINSQADIKRLHIAECLICQEEK